MTEPVRLRAAPDSAWWRGAVTVQVYLRSFQDSDGDGVGDLPGLLRRLPYLAELGVDAVWLSPVHPSPNVDFGYDVADYEGVDAQLGGLQALDEVIEAAHALGMRVILDWVVNHTSDQHPWFVASRSSREDPKRDWYLWADGKGGRPPNNWPSTFGGPAWTRDAATGQFYSHGFAPEQPDLNWRNAEVQEAVLGAMRFWLERGVDGFRLDVFNAYVKEATLADNPRRWNPLGLFYGYVGQEHVNNRDQAALLPVLGAMRSLADAFGAVLVGETLDERFLYEQAASYVGTGKLHLAFHFGLLHSPWRARRLGAALKAWVSALPAEGTPTWVLSNHDFKRATSRWGGGDARAKAMAVLQLGLPGACFVYYGEEIGMLEGRLRRREIVDPPGRRFWPVFKGRDGARTPMQWDGGEYAGFSEAVPWLPVNPDARSRNVAAQAGSPGSVLEVYRAMIALRKAYPALAIGELVLDGLDAGPVLSWRCEAGGAVVRVFVNTAGGSRALVLGKGERALKLLLSTADAPADLMLAPNEGRVLLVGAL